MECCSRKKEEGKERAIEEKEGKQRNEWLEVAYDDGDEDEDDLARDRAW